MQYRLFNKINEFCDEITGDILDIEESAKFGEDLFEFIRNEVIPNYFEDWEDGDLVTVNDIRQIFKEEGLIK